ncbi:MAG: GGDEF domain-containing protein [Nitrospirota bacterium]
MFAPTAPLDPGIYQYFLEMETVRSIRYSHFFSLCHLGIDQDGTNTHAMVRSVADIVRQTIRETDLIGFANDRTLSVLLLNTEIQGAYVVAERVRNRVAEQTFSNEHAPIQLTTSIGGACFPTHGNDAITLLSRADEMLALARSQGGNQTAVPPS